MLRTRSSVVFFGTQEQVTPKWIVRSGRNSISSESFGCSDYLKVWRWFDQNRMRCPPDKIFFHCKSMVKTFVAQKRVTPKWMVRSGPKSNTFKILWLSSYRQVWRRSDQKWSRYPPNNIFPIISLWALSVSVETRGLIRSAPKHYAAFPRLNDAPYKIWIGLTNWPKSTRPCAGVRNDNIHHLQPLTSD